MDFGSSRAGSRMMETGTYYTSKEHRIGRFASLVHSGLETHGTQEWNNVGYKTVLRSIRSGS